MTQRGKRSILRHRNDFLSGLSVDLVALGAAAVFSMISYAVTRTYILASVSFAIAVILTAVVTRRLLHAEIISIVSAVILAATSLQDGRGEVRIAVLFMLVVLYSGLSILVVRMLSQSDEEKRASDKQYTKEKLINDINQRILLSRTSESIELLALESLCELTGKPGAIFVNGKNGIECVFKIPRWLIMYPEDQRSAEEAFRLGKKCGVGTADKNSSLFLFSPITSRGKVLALAAIRFGVDNKPGEDMLSAIDLVLSQASLAMTRQDLLNEQNQLLLESEKEKVRNDFLRAISHDLRTPLAGIISACSTIQESAEALSLEEKDELVADIRSEAEWLLSMVENLLSVTKATGGSDVLKKSLEPVDDVVWGAVERILLRYPGIDIQTKLPDDVIFAKMDANLIVQVLSNLIENAIKYSGSQKPIIVTVEVKGAFAEFSVRDYGVGLSENVLQTLFESRAIKSESGSYGLGIGLSICKTIIQAHNGSITGENAADGGALFRFTIPTEEI